MPELVQFKSAKTLADEGLVSALMSLVEKAGSGEIKRLVCVCIGEDQRFYKITHHAADLALVGALSIVTDDIKASSWQSSPW